MFDNRWGVRTRVRSAMPYFLVILVMAMLLFSGCAATPVVPKREAVAMPELVAWPPPPEAELVMVDAEYQACYTLDKAAALAETLDASAAINDQAQQLLQLASHLDAEAEALSAGQAQCLQHVAEQEQSHFLEIALYRLGLVTSWLLALAAAL